VLIALWSPKGGSGTSVLAAACAITLARTHHDVRIADFDGDQSALVGVSADPELGLCDWLGAGPQAPGSALRRIAVEINGGLVLLPPGRADDAAALPEAGAALGVLLRDDAAITIADLGRADSPARQALAEVADHSLGVVRGCYLALRRLVHHPLAPTASGFVLVDEAGRVIGRRDLASITGRPVLGRVAVRTDIARRVDAGLLVTRPPDQLTDAVSALLTRVGVLPPVGRAA
jgi:cellulose biosynthesis protein BcsQ